MRCLQAAFPPSRRRERAIQTNDSITPRRQNVKKRRNTAYYGLVMGINTWTEKQNSGSAGLYSIPRRLLYQDHGGGKLSRVRQHRESGLPLMGCCRSDRSRKGGGDKCKPSGLACSIPLSLLPPLGGREGVKPLPRAGRKQHAVQQRKI